MWNAMVVTVMCALAGYYATMDYAESAAIEHARAEKIAESMAVYRETVIAYFSMHANAYQSVDINTLKASGAVPSWASLDSGISAWANYRDSDGMIYIYAPVPPAVDIVPEMVALSQNSMFAGVHRAGSTTLQSPIFGDTQIKLPAAGSVSIPDGSPVWIAMRR